MEEFVPILTLSPLFSGVAEADLPALLACLGARTLRISKGGILLREGESATALGIVLHGAVQVSSIDYDGSRSLIARIEPPNLFAEAFAFAGSAVLPVSVTAAEDTLALLIPASRITQPCASACGFHQHLIFNLMRILARKNLALSQKLEITAKRTTRGKLMAYLMQQSALSGGRSFTIPFDRQELADYLEVDRSGLCAEIGRLRREGVLQSDRSHFTLLT